VKYCSLDMASDIIDDPDLSAAIFAGELNAK